MALEKFGNDLNPERIHFALQSAGKGQNSASFERLKDSIQASGGIVVPIAVIQSGNRFTCIDGNTRLAIYKLFFKEGIRGEWSTINSTLLENPSQKEIETIRVAAHLVGAREWPAYEKARHLHELRNTDFLEYAKIIALRDENKADIERQICACEDMNEYYRNNADDSALKIDRFNKFVELQRPKIKKAIFAANLDLGDFGNWIKSRKIRDSANVRSLPRVLRDNQARKIFFESSANPIEDAKIHLDQKRLSADQESKVALKQASIEQLAVKLARRIGELPYCRFQEYQKPQNENT